MEDIFRNDSLMELRNKSLYEIKEVRTIIFGLLFFICPLTKYQLNDGPILKLKTNVGDTEIYFYSKGDEFWFNMIDLPGEES